MRWIAKRREQGDQRFYMWWGLRVGCCGLLWIVNAKAFRWSRGCLVKKRGLVCVVIGCCDWMNLCADLVGANLRGFYTALRAYSSCVAGEDSAAPSLA